MDPFSIITGTVGFLDVCFRVGQYLRSLKNSVTTIDEELTALQTETDLILSTHRSLESIWAAHYRSLPGQSKANAHHADNLWGGVRKSLKDAELIV